MMVLDYTKKGKEQTIIEDISREKAHRVRDILNELSEENEQLQKELEKFKKWEKHIGDVRREDLDRVFKMSIYEIAEAFGYYKERIRVLEEELEE